jgi:putative oxidoreductase
MRWRALRARPTSRTGTDLGLLLLRLVVGGLLCGHGSQKLFGWFGGPGPHGTTEMLRSLRLRPPQPWATVAGIGELGSGLFTALGFLSPLGPVMVFGPMGMATLTAHAGKPIWVTEGGPELPVVNMSVAAALILAGPGRFSLDHALGIALPRWIALPALAGVGTGIALGLASRAPQPVAEAGQPVTVQTPGPEVVAPT